MKRKEKEEQMTKRNLEVPEVIEVQVGGVLNCKTLEEACKAYLNLLKEACPNKIHFYIQLRNSKTGSITLRQEKKAIIVYGDFPDMVDTLELAQIWYKRGGKL